MRFGWWMQDQSIEVPAGLGGETRIHVEAVCLRGIDVSYCSQLYLCLLTWLRMYFGRLKIQIPILHFPLIDCMQIMVACSIIVFRAESICRGTWMSSSWNNWWSCMNWYSMMIINIIFISVNRMNMLPRWRGLNHFGELMKISFTDGSKHEDISKAVIWRNVFTANCRTKISPI